MRTLKIWFAGALAAAALGVTASHAAPLTSQSAVSEAARDMNAVQTVQGKDPRDGGQVKAPRTKAKKAAKKSKRPARSSGVGRDPRDGGPPPAK